MRRLALALLAAAAAAAALLPGGASARVGPTPILAYYYIWFDATSWNRGKSDYPMVGRYSSDEARVMAEQVRLAKRAGIDGFIVSWKNTPTLDRRLARLISIAKAQDFKLAVIYEGLDYYRRPLPATRVGSDLSFFASHYAADSVFDLFGKPLVVWSGTWKFSRAEISAATAGLRRKLLLLASERNLAGYRRVADLVDGDAYYWSSVNPATYPDYPRKLDRLSRAVHAHGGLWIAPAATGFDARLVGGRSVVPRRDAQTLARELATSLASTPDAIGVISWNEYSENTQVEPSVRYGYRALEEIARVSGLDTHFVSTVDSSSGGAATSGRSGFVAIALFCLLAAACACLPLLRRPRLAGGPGGKASGPR